MSVDSVLVELIQLSHELGREDRNLVILGEGILSADCGDGTFWVKAYGSNMPTIDREGFSRIRFQKVMDLTKVADLAEEQIVQGLRDSLVEEGMRQPSVETFLHAICLNNTEANYIAHTHPTAVLSILCSTLGVEPFMKHIFHEPIPIYGTAPAVVPYVDASGLNCINLSHSIAEYFPRRNRLPANSHRAKMRH